MWVEGVIGFLAFGDSVIRGGGSYHPQQVLLHNLVLVVIHWVVKCWGEEDHPVLATPKLGGRSKTDITPNLHLRVVVDCWQSHLQWITYLLKKGPENPKRPTWHSWIWEDLYPCDGPEEKFLWLPLLGINYAGHGQGKITCPSKEIWIFGCLLLRKKSCKLI